MYVNNRFVTSASVTSSGRSVDYVDISGCRALGR